MMKYVIAALLAVSTTACFGGQGPTWSGVIAIPGNAYAVMSPRVFPTNKILGTIKNHTAALTVFCFDDKAVAGMSFSGDFNPIANGSIVNNRVKTTWDTDIITMDIHPLTTGFIFDDTVAAIKHMITDHSVKVTVDWGWRAGPVNYLISLHGSTKSLNKLGEICTKTQVPQQPVAPARPIYNF
jgi:hypothetical protein